MAGDGCWPSTIQGRGGRRPRNLLTVWFEAASWAAWTEPTVDECGLSGGDDMAGGRTSSSVGPDVLYEGRNRQLIRAPSVGAQCERRRVQGLTVGFRSRPGWLFEGR
jgi:hypothetical protein